MILVNPEAVKADGKTQKVFASEDFAFRLHNRRQPHTIPASDPPAIAKLHRLVQTCFPNYSELCSERFSVHKLLQDNAYVADLAFITAAWRYSKCLGRVSFPCGVFGWPPGPAEIGL
jgi:hypothetical protein